MTNRAHDGVITARTMRDTLPLTEITMRGDHSKMVIIRTDHHTIWTGRTGNPIIRTGRTARTGSLIIIPTGRTIPITGIRVKKIMEGIMTGP